MNTKKPHNNTTHETPLSRSYSSVHLPNNITLSSLKTTPSLDRDIQQPQRAATTYKPNNKIS